MTASENVINKQLRASGVDRRANDLPICPRISKIGAFASTPPGNQARTINPRATYQSRPGTAEAILTEVSVSPVNVVSRLRKAM